MKRSAARPPAPQSALRETAERGKGRLVHRLHINTANRSGAKSACVPQQNREQRHARPGPDDDADVTNGHQGHPLQAGRLAVQHSQAARV